MAYREPDGTEEDLTGTDLKEQFYVYLQGLPTDEQVIIIENTDPSGFDQSAAAGRDVQQEPAQRPLRFVPAQGGRSGQSLRLGLPQAQPPIGGFL